MSKAQTAEMEREGVGRLLVPMVHVERSITRATTIISLEIPDEELRYLRTRRDARRWISRVLQGFGDTFLAHWARAHPEPEEDGCTP